MARKSSKSLPAVYVKDSAVHGKGLFAGAPIPADTLIMRVEGKPTRKDGIYVIWPHDAPEGSEGLRITNDTRFVNHANKPNAAFYDMELWSLRAIKKDEEITHDYGPGWEELG